MNKEKKCTNDVFAEIASQRIEYRNKNLQEPTPPILPDKFLPTNNDISVSFNPIIKIDSTEKLYTKLGNYREKFLPFMQNMAPSVAQTRFCVKLAAFDWRIETLNDQKDFPSVLAGKGEWEKVNIPHYGPPVGSAVTYYKTSFKITKEQLDAGSAFICFKGVDYKSHVFINGSYIGSHEGFFAPFEFDFTKAAKIGENIILIKVENDFIMGGNKSWGQDHSGNKIYAATGLGYDEPSIGWHHCPPGMGIYQDVYIEYRPQIFISDIFVRPLPEKNMAEAWIEIHNTDIDEKEIILNFSVYGRNFKETVFENIEYKPSSMNINGLNDDYNIASDKANGTFNKPVPLLMTREKNLLKIPFRMENYRIWNNDSPWLYQIQVKLMDKRKQIIDTQQQHFGMRSFYMDENSNPKGALYLNGNPIRLRGANTMGHEQQCVFKGDFDQLIDDILLAKICNMNFLRLTQRPVQPEVYDYCDMLGLMTQSDLPTFGCIRKNQYIEALKQVSELEKLVRCHPCNIVISYINEPFPNGQNKPHCNMSRQEMEDFFRAADDIVKHLNPDRVIKACDGDYDPPAPGIQDRHCYPTWYNGQGVDIGMLIKGYWQPTKNDWYYACGEFGAEALEDEKLMRQYYPLDWLPANKEEEKNWSPDSIVSAQTGKFHYFFYDSQDTVSGWIDSSQKHQARSLKIMAETFRRNNHMNSFAVHLFIDAWPSGWMKAIMDCKRQPKLGYFAYRNALAPLLTSVRTDRTKFYAREKIKLEAWISNDLPHAYQNLYLHYQLESKGKIIFAQKSKAEIEICKSTFQGYIELSAPPVTERENMTVRVALIDNKGNIINDNAVDVEIFPQISHVKGNVSLVGNNGPGRKLANELGLDIADLGKSKTILVSDFSEYKDKESIISLLVKSGARVIFLELPNEDKYEIAGSIVDVKMSRFNPLHFASRKTGHELVEGLKEFDFNYWYDAKSQMIKPIIESTFTCNNFKPILFAGNANDNAQWCRVLAAGKKQFGQGSYIICQVQLGDRIESNPTAKIFALRLLNLKYADTVKKENVQLVSLNPKRKSGFIEAGKGRL
jgi:hypothetical protein